MAFNASRAPLSPPAPRPRKRGRYPQAYGAAAGCATSQYIAPFHDRRWQNPAGPPRRWQNPAGAPRRVWQGFRAPHTPVPSRQWVFADDASTSGGDACTIMSYNILADIYARNHHELYSNVPWDALRWDSRRRLILREIRHWDSDLVCLQEVDRFREIAADMKSRGYECIFKERDSGDGCATFWKSDRLRLLDEDSIDFSEFNLWNNVAQVLVFEVVMLSLADIHLSPEGWVELAGSREGELNGAQKFVIGNIHVMFRPKRGDVKLGQIRMLLEKANALAEKWDGIPVVLAGDFNSTPDSALYKFLSTMKLNISSHDKTQLSGPLVNCEPDSSEPCSQWSAQEVRNATGNSNVLVARHQLKLSSSYAMLKGNSSNRGHNGEPRATSYHDFFLGTVDYLWYTPGLKCSRVLDTLPIGALKKTRGLPTREMGSDHLPIVAEFVFTERTPDASEEEDDSEEEDESEQEDDEPARKASTAKHIYFSDSDG